MGVITLGAGSDIWFMAYHIFGYVVWCLCLGNDVRGLTDMGMLLSGRPDVDGCVLSEVNSWLQVSALVVCMMWVVRVFRGVGSAADTAAGDSGARFITSGN